MDVAMDLNMALKKGPQRGWEATTSAGLPIHSRGGSGHLFESLSLGGGLRASGLVGVGLVPGASKGSLLDKECVP